MKPNWPAAALAILTLPFAAAELLSPHSPVRQFRHSAAQPPGAEPAFPWGTDDLGRDLLSRFLHGGRVSLFAGAGAATVAVVLGGAAGAICAALGGWVDAIGSRLADLTLALPWLYLLLGARAWLPLALPPHWTLFLLMLLLGCVGSGFPFRIARQAVRTAQAEPWVLAAEGFGASPGYILRAHLLPAALRPLRVEWASLIPRFVAAEVSLSFLGLGISDPGVSWGSILASLKQYPVLTTQWWMAAPVAGLALFSWLLAAWERRLRLLAPCLALIAILTPALSAQTRGGELVISLRTEPRTLNPVLALDGPSRDVLSLLMADLVHINRETMRAEPELALNWTRQEGGKRITVQLREGLRFSDGHPLTAEDVAFSFQLYQDPAVGSPARSLLSIGGQPLRVQVTGPRTLQFDFAEPYGPGERLFDSLPVLPKHLLEPAYRAGEFAKLWTLAVNPQAYAGAGPFRLRAYQPGQRMALERNPHYWKPKLPYLDALRIEFMPDPDAELLQFRSGRVHLAQRLTGKNFAALQSELAPRGYQFIDAGPGFEFHFLFFNQNEPAASLSDLDRAKRAWFRNAAFRRAISLAVDRQGIVKLAFGGRAAAVWGPVTPANREWRDASLPTPAPALAEARNLLKQAGFQWRADGRLRDGSGRPVEISLITNAANPAQMQAAAILEQDLKELGIALVVNGLEFRSLVDRVLTRREYDAALMALSSGDADPGAEMGIWLLDGRSHFWNLNPREPQPWEREADQLMRRQMASADPALRKRLYAQVQRIAREQLPFVCFAAPHVLTAAHPDLRNVKRAVLAPYALAGAAELHWAAGKLH